jgi:hypothetical protein
VKGKKRRAAQDTGELAIAVLPITSRSNGPALTHTGHTLAT